MKERMMQAITSWLPLSTIAAGIAMIAGSLLNLPSARVMMAAIITALTTFSAFVMRSYGKEDQHLEQKAGQQN